MLSLGLRLRCAIEDFRLTLSIIFGLARRLGLQVVFAVVFEICPCWTANIPTIKQSFEDETGRFCCLVFNMLFVVLNWYVMVEEMFVSPIK